MTNQPDPEGGEGDCWLDLIDAAGEQHPFRERMLERRQVGIERYGQPLRRGDGRDEIRDLVEELLDGAVYAQRLGWGRLALHLLDLATISEGLRPPPRP